MTECDTEGGSYTPAADTLIPVDKALGADGSISLETDAAGGSLVNFDLDLVGCKQFIKIKVEVVWHRRYLCFLRRYRRPGAGR